jgi:hypothetical protein
VEREGERVMAGRKILGYASVGAVRQHDASLPVFACSTCGNEIAFPTSKRTGRKYAVNVRRNYRDARFYMGHDIHKCAEVMAQRERDAKSERWTAWVTAQTALVVERYRATIAGLPKGDALDAATAATWADVDALRSLDVTKVTAGDEDGFPVGIALSPEHRRFVRDRALAEFDERRRAAATGGAVG